MCNFLSFLGNREKTEKDFIIFVARSKAWRGLPAGSLQILSLAPSLCVPGFSQANRGGRGCAYLRHHASILDIWRAVDMNCPGWCWRILAWGRSETCISSDFSSPVIETPVPAGMLGSRNPSERYLLLHSPLEVQPHWGHRGETMITVFRACREGQEKALTISLGRIQYTLSGYF